MTGGDDHLMSVAALFSDAALGGDWEAALAGLAKACTADNGQLVGIGANAAVPFNWISNRNGRTDDEWLALRGGDPARNPRVRVGLSAPRLKAWHDLDCFDPETRARYAECCDLFIRLDLPYGSQATLIRDEEILIGVATLRGARLGQPSPEDRRAFEALVPHIRDAVRLQMTLEGQGAAVMAGALDAVGAAAFILDGSGRLRAATQAGETALASGPLRLRSQRLGAARDDQSRLLDAAVEAALQGPAGATDRPMRTVPLRPVDDPSSLVLADVVSLPARAHALGFQPRVLVTLRGVSRRDADLARHLRAAFGLTPAEAEIALRLLDGDSREAIADDRQASVQTVRSQVKSLFAKLGVRRTAELTARFGRLR